MTVIAGAYYATWNALSIGNTEGGIRTSYNYEGRQIRFDSVGSSLVDVLRTGLAMFLDFVLMEYDAAAVDDLRWPFHSFVGTYADSGASMWAAAKPLILTSCRNDIDPATITFPKTILAPGYNVELDYSGSKERVVPLRLIVFPVKYQAEPSSNYEQPNGCEDAIFFEETLQA